MPFTAVAFGQSLSMGRQIFEALLCPIDELGVSGYRPVRRANPPLEPGSADTHPDSPPFTTADYETFAGQRIEYFIGKNDPPKSPRQFIDPVDIHRFCGLSCLDGSKFIGLSGSQVGTHLEKA